MKYNSNITINDLRLYANLGFTKEERISKQEISLDVGLYFKEAPDACYNDRLEDTICYGKIIGEIENFLRKKEFKLLEYLTLQIHSLINNLLNSDNIKIKIRITKLNVPIIQKVASTSFEYSNL